MNAPNASSSSSEEPRARAQRFAVSRTSTRCPSSSRSRSASAARASARLRSALSVSRRRPMTRPASMPTRTRANAVRHCSPGPSASITIVAPVITTPPTRPPTSPKRKRCRRDRDQVEGPPRLAGLEREDRDEADRDERVESEQQHSGANAVGRPELDHREHAREDGFRGEEPDDRPGPGLVGRRKVREGDRDRADDHERRPQQDEPAARAAKHPAPPAARAPRRRPRASSRPDRRGRRSRRPVRRPHPRCLPRPAR